jgi:hypothetical protein
MPATTMPRILRALLLLVLLLPAAARAQQKTDSASMQQAYETRRSELLKELQTTQDSLGSLRSQRVRLEARIDNVLAQSTEARAQQLLLSGDLNALLQLDAVLAQAQENMNVQRTRMVALGDAVRKRSGAVLVVLFRADSAPVGTVTGLELTIDNASAATRSYSPTSATALSQGAVDELYRSEMLPTIHTVQAQATMGGQPVTAALNVQATANAVTYVQFSVKDGKLTSSSWTSAGTAP